MKRTRFGKKSERGAAAMELALLLPVISALIFGAVDFGRMLWFQEVLVNATREGARRAILFNTPYTQGQIAGFVSQSLQAGGVPTAGLQVTVNGLNAASGNPVVVQANVPWNYIVIDSLVPGLSSTQLNANVTMLHE